MNVSEAPKNLRVVAVYMQELRSLISSIACERWTCHRDLFLPADGNTPENENVPYKNSATVYRTAKNKLHHCDIRYD